MRLVALRVTIRQNVNRCTRHAAMPKQELSEATEHEPPGPTWSASTGNATRGLPQPLRLIIAAGYVLALMLVAQVLNGQPLPPYGLDGLWFYAAFAALVLGEFLLEPFFATPADAIANGVALLLAAASTSLAEAAVSSQIAETGRSILIAYAVLVIGLGVIAVALKDQPGWRGATASVASSTVRRAGRARWVFSVLLFAAGYAAFADDAGKLAILYLAWFTILVGRPLEAAARWWTGRPRTKLIGGFGIVDGAEDPGIVLARVARGTVPRLGAAVAVEGSNRPVGTVVDLTTLAEEPRIRIALEEGARMPMGGRVRLLDEPSPLPVIGHVAEGTTLEEVHVRTVPAAAQFGLAEGRLLSIAIGKQRAMYQITGGETFGRSEEGMRRDLVRVVGRKLGAWNEGSGSFEPVPWLPAPGTPVSVLVQREVLFAPELVGHVPGAEFGVSVDLDQLVTHNTAILGILGAGKTHLAWELVSRMLVKGIKVVCLDISGRYGQQFEDVCSPETEGAIANEIEAAISANHDNRVVRDNEAGNLRDFISSISTVLSRFMAGNERLLILNPNRFRVTRMKGNPFSGSANLLTDLTMVEVTRTIAEQLLALVQAEARDPKDDTARLCLVLEEAHSLVPEWNSTANEQEQQAVNGTARAILQGRKYGYGCLLITQRTANVTKSILNQCNTVFGMRAFDATGMGFLENYIGPTYARLLASLRDRQAVVFGRASSCKAPLIVDLNDATDFDEGFWKPAAGSVPSTVALPDSVADAQEADAGERSIDADLDDVPF
jgi:hypothetical protein